MTKEVARHGIAAARAGAIPNAVEASGAASHVAADDPREAVRRVTMDDTTRLAGPGIPRPRKPAARMVRDPAIGEAIRRPAADVPNEIARPVAKGTKTHATGLAVPRTRKRTARKPATVEAHRTSVADDLGDALTAGFKKAVEAAIQQAFDSDLAVPGRENGTPVERRPDGKIVKIEDPANWSPDAWKSRP